MKILITGASGFIGQAVLRELAGGAAKLAPDDIVIALDKRDRAANQPAGQAPVRFIRCDLCGMTADALKELSDTDVVIHLAASVHDTRISLQEHMRVNYEATRGLFDKFIEVSKSPLKQFIFVSSVSVFGNYKDGEYPEECDCRPDTPYGESKLLAEEYIKASAGCGKDRFKYTILRLATVFGGADDKGNVGKMITFIKKFGLFPVFDYDARKSFLYVDDAARAIAACVNNSKAFNETFNIGASPVTMREMLDDIRSVLGVRFITVGIPLQILRNIAAVKKLSRDNAYSTSKAADRLNFTARDFKSGLSDMICRSGGRWPCI